MPVRPDKHHNPLDFLADATQGVEVRFPPGMPLPIQRLMGTLGVRVVFDEKVQGDYVAARKDGRFV